MIVGRTVTSPLPRRRLSTTPLCRRQELDSEASCSPPGLVQPTLLTELVLPKGCRLDPGVALPACARGRLGAVHWRASSRRVDTALPTLSSVARTTAYEQNSFDVISTQIPCRCLPRCTPAPARARSRCLSTAER
jgi:hypothetical protein